jgi:hypothetical protein
MLGLGTVMVVAGVMSCNGDEEPAGLVNAGGGGTAGAGGAGQAGNAAGAAGSGGSISSAGGGGTGGGSGSAGAAGTSVVDAGADQSIGSDARADAAFETGSETTTDTGSTSDAGDGGTTSYALAVGSDFVSGSVKLVAVDWSTKQIAGTTVFPNVGLSDAIPVVSGGRGFMIERTDSKLIVLQKDKPWLSSKVIDLADADAGPLGVDPVAVISTGTKAYVPLYFQNRISIVNVDAGTVTGNIDLSAFQSPVDNDGLVDVFDGVYDPSTHRAYFLLAQIPQLQKGIEPDRVASCIASVPSIIAVDTTNDQIIDLNGDAGGSGWPLVGRNATAFVPDLARNRLLIVDAGCYELEGGDMPDGGPAQAALPRVGRGVEALSLATGTTTFLYSHTESTRLSGLVVVDATHGFLSADDAFYTTHWYPWDPSSGATHGAEVSALPQFAPHYVGANLVVGISPTYVDGGVLNAFVSFNVTTSAVSTLVPDIFGDVSFTGQYNGWALLP